MYRQKVGARELQLRPRESVRGARARLAGAPRRTLRSFFDSLSFFDFLFFLFCERMYVQSLWPIGIMLLAPHAAHFAWMTSFLML